MFVFYSFLQSAFEKIQVFFPVRRLYTSSAYLLNSDKEVTDKTKNILVSSLKTFGKRVKYFDIWIDHGISSIPKDFYSKLSVQFLEKPKIILSWMYEFISVYVI